MVTPAIHYTMGGVDINNSGNVVDNYGNGIEGLYASGEIVSGIHGDNRLAGNSLLDCVVFGMIASTVNI